VFFTLF